jgi:hypothetical protein
VLSVFNLGGALEVGQTDPLDMDLPFSVYLVLDHNVVELYVYPGSATAFAHKCPWRLDELGSLTTRVHPIAGVQFSESFQDVEENLIGLSGGDFVNFHESQQICGEVWMDESRFVGDRVDL